MLFQLPHNTTDSTRSARIVLCDKRFADKTEYYDMATTDFWIHQTKGDYIICTLSDTLKTETLAGQSGEGSNRKAVVEFGYTKKGGDDVVYSVVDMPDWVKVKTDATAGITFTADTLNRNIGKRRGDVVVEKKYTHEGTTSYDMIRLIQSN